MQPRWILVSGCLVLAVIIAGTIMTSTSPDESGPGVVIQEPAESFALGTTLPESPAAAPVYQVLSNDAFSLSFAKSIQVRNSTPSEADALVLAGKVLETYGGLPRDAVLKKVVRNTIKKYNTKTGVIEEEYPESTEVIYGQQVDGRPVLGSELTVSFGENGELLGISKSWRTVGYAGEVPIISSGEAYAKLRNGETLRVCQCSTTGTTVTSIALGYSAEDRDRDQKNYTPIWIFYAAKEGMEAFPFLVDAVKTP
jgi:hypothetical protein